VAFLQPDIVPAMAEAIHRQLVAARSGRLAIESLAANVVPAGLSKGEIGAKYFGDTVRELASIGVIEVEDGHARLGGARDETGVAGAMPRLVRARAMAAERDTDLWEKDDAGSLMLLGARDLVRALAWFLSLNVLHGPFTFNKEANPLAQLQEDHTGERLIFNEDRWRPFVRWARYLGFMRDVPFYSGSGRSEPGVVPDPTDAVADVLTRCVSGGDPMPLSALLPALATELPVLDGGIYRNAVHQRGAPASDADVSPSLTLAFERLRARGDIELDVGAGDAEKVVFANNRGAFHALRLTGAGR
jgi:hypothetical protein